MKILTPKEALDKAMGVRDFFNAETEKKILKAMKEYAKQEVASASDSGSNFSSANKATDDHEFNLHQHWTADNTNDFDGPTIKHFQD